MIYIVAIILGLLGNKIYKELLPKKYIANNNFILILSILILVLISVYAVGYSNKLIILILVELLVMPAVFIDQKSFILPNKLTVSLILFGIFLLFLNNPFTVSAKEGLLGGGVMFILFLIFSFLGMGFGDLKLMTGLGLIFGIRTIILGTIIGFLLGSLEGILIWIIKGYKKDTEMPFGPTLSLGVFIAVFIVYSTGITLYDVLLYLGW